LFEYVFFGFGAEGSQISGSGPLLMHYTTLQPAVFNTLTSHSRELFTNYVRFIAPGAISVITFHCLPSPESWLGWVSVGVNICAVCVCPRCLSIVCQNVVMTRLTVLGRGG